MRSVLIGYREWTTGCGAAWLARLTGGQEVGSSNLPSPTQHRRSEHSATAVALRKQAATTTPRPAAAIAEPLGEGSTSRRVTGARSSTAGESDQGLSRVS